MDGALPAPAGPLAAGLRLYLAGYTFTPTPGNVGEAARGLLLARQPLGAADSLAIFGAERLADLLALVLLALPGLWWLAQRPEAAAWQFQLMARQPPSRGWWRSASCTASGEHCLRACPGCRRPGAAWPAVPGPGWV